MDADTAVNTSACLVQTLVDQHRHLELCSLLNDQSVQLIPRVTVNAVKLLLVQYNVCCSIEYIL